MPKRDYFLRVERLALFISIELSRIESSYRRNSTFEDVWNRAKSLEDRHHQLKWRNLPSYDVDQAAVCALLEHGRILRNILLDEDALLPNPTLYNFKQRPFSKPKEIDRNYRFEFWSIQAEIDKHRHEMARSAPHYENSNTLYRNVEKLHEHLDQLDIIRENDPLVQEIYAEFKRITSK